MKSMETTKTDIGLRESAKLFSEAMAERYFKYAKKGSSMLLITGEDGELSSCMLGKGGDLINAIASSMSETEEINRIVGTAFMLANNESLAELLKQDNDNGTGDV